MWPLLLAVVAGTSAALLAGRRPPAAVGLRWWPLLPAGAAAAAIALRFGGGSPGTAVAVAGYAGLAAFAVLNRARPGMLLMAVGLAANGLVVGLDAGMPVDVAAGGMHHTLAPTDRLTGLADVIPVAGLRMSAGDVLLCLGAAAALFFWMEPATRDRA